MLRLNHILIGQNVTLYDHRTQTVLFSCAKLIGWSLRGKFVNAPKIMKHMDSRMMMIFELPTKEIIQLVKSPDGQGCMFLNTSEGIWRVVAKK